MSINVRWLAIVILVLGWGIQPLIGQDCPSVTDALKTLYEAKDEGDAMVRVLKANCPHADDSLSVIFHKRSVYAYSSEEDLDGAIVYALRALEAQEKIYAKTPTEPLGKTMANLGLFYRMNGQYTMSLPYLRKAIAIFTELGIYDRKRKSQQQMVMLWHATGDIGRSEELLRVLLAEARVEKVTTKDIRRVTISEAETLRLLGEQASQMEKYAEGLSDFKAAEVLFEELGYITSLLEAYMGQGRAFFHLKRYEEAQAITEEALALAEPHELNYDKAVMLNLLALISMEQQQFSAAGEFLQRGVSFAQKEDSPRALAVLFNTSAEIALAQDDFINAETRSAEAIALLTNGWKYNEETRLPTVEQLIESEFKQDVFQFLAIRADILKEKGDLAGALEVVQLTDQLADLLRMDFDGQVSNLFWRQEALPLYELGIELSRKGDDPEGTFYFLEKSRSILLLEALFAADVQESIVPELADRLATTEHKLRQERREIAGKDTIDPEGKALRVVALSDTLQQLRSELADRYPGARALLAKPTLSNISETREILKQGEWDRQIHFFLGEENTIAFSLSATETQTVDLGPTEDVDAIVRQVLAYYTSAGMIDQAPADFIAASYAAYEKLLAPLDIEEGERLLIIPDGTLAYLPFAALITDPKTTDLANAAYLVRRNQVSFAQSTTVLSRQLAVQAKTKKDAFAFSPFTTALSGNVAPVLPFSKEEIEGFQQHYSADWLNGKDASRDKLLNSLEGRSLIHLSTHAFASTNHKEFPRVLTATDPVYLADIYGLRLQADLVTLSACQSNIGPLAQGEGVLGLGRAFTAAGAGGVVASLWSLNDRATSAIVTGFYDELARGARKPEALHKAKLAYLKQEDLPAYLKSPYYWAGLTYYGDSGKLPSGGGIPVWAWALLLLVGLGFVMWRWFGRA